MVDRSLSRSLILFFSNEHLESMYNRQSIVHSRIHSSVPVHSPIQWQHPRNQTWRHHLIGPSGWEGGVREGGVREGEGREEEGERSKCYTGILSLILSNQPLPPHCVFAQCISNQQTLAARPRPCQAFVAARLAQGLVKHSLHRQKDLPRPLACVIATISDICTHPYMVLSPACHVLPTHESLGTRLTHIHA